MLIKNYSIRFFLLIGALLIVAISFAQTRKPVAQKPASNKPAQQKQVVNVPLKLKPLWGNHPGGNMLVADGVNYADSALRVIDDKGNRYPVISFKFIYKRKSSYTDDQTGVVKNGWDAVATDVTGDTILSEVWRNSIKESLQKDEEWTIDYIMVKDKSGRKVMATPMNFKFK
ncbi:MAG: hypothetical protein HYR66_03095 [Sphingobacteriales bacterium]|nr:hypothetical protein [Sphingobacteriales bacterium]MBI3719256.1 hypothetical protein [Sphingobacteriales bacterium]